MSEALNIPAYSEPPRRGRPPRVQANAEVRRRRNPGSLDRMQQFKLDIFGPEDLDLTNFVYYWMNDEGSNIRRMTKLDDYEFVTPEELGDAYNPDATDSESNGRIRVLVGNKQDGSPLYAYYLKKPRWMWEEDYEVGVVQAREDMMAGRVYGGEANDSQESRPGGEDKFYVPAGNTIGHAAQRRRGAVPRTLK